MVTHKNIHTYVRRGPHWDPPPQKKIAQNVLRVFPKGVKFTGVPGKGFPGKGSEIDKSPGALHAPTPSGNGVDTGVGKPPQYEPITLWNVFYLGVPQRLPYRQ